MCNHRIGPFKCFVIQWRDVRIPGKKRYEGVRFNVICVTKGWVGVKFPGKKRYVTLAWPQSCMLSVTDKEVGLVDKILSNCDSIKTAVINILEFYTQVQETGAITGKLISNSHLVPSSRVRPLETTAVALIHLSRSLASHLMLLMEGPFTLFTVSSHLTVLGLPCTLE